MKRLSATFVKGIRGTDDILQTDIPSVALIGRSNVGKSSVINALTGHRELARVGAKPGKTTEINYFLVRNAYHLIDLPGYGFAAVSPKERDKLRKLIIWFFTSGEASPTHTYIILDAKVGITRFDEEMIGILTECALPFSLVLNKVDKLTQKELAAQRTNIAGHTTSECIEVSAATGKGIDTLREKIEHIAL